jgi:hypothetical protein
MSLFGGKFEKEWDDRGVREGWIFLKENFFYLKLFKNCVLPGMVFKIYHTSKPPPQPTKKKIQRSKII